MQTHAVAVRYRYTREELLTVFVLARQEDVEEGGRYDARSAAINMYTHPWTTEMMPSESTIMGTFYASWGEDNHSWKIEIDEGFSMEDLLVELGTLEEKALGRKIHGR